MITAAILIAGLVACVLAFGLGRMGDDMDDLDHDYVLIKSGDDA